MLIDSSPSPDFAGNEFRKDGFAGLEDDRFCSVLFAAFLEAAFTVSGRANGAARFFFFFVR